MSAQQHEPRCPTAAPLLGAGGGLILILIVAAILTAGWRDPTGKGARVVHWTANVNLVSEQKGLPGRKENSLRASLHGVVPDEARKLNAAIPIAQAAVTPALPFRFVGRVADRMRATDCLALAAMAEAGYSDEGQRAVIQVVLNRVRHPVFAKTICGVVFEGSHRASGCQFTFTCDGALVRRYSAASWTDARERASQALDGRIYARVGLATHYHTDWVHPYWSDALTKLSRVGTHLFFRWPGYGDAALLSVPYRGSEPAIKQLAYLAAHDEPAETAATQIAVSQPTSGAALIELIVRGQDGGAFVLLTGAPSATLAREMGRSICNGRPSCKVLGWFERGAIPAGYPVPSSARARLGFSYFRDAHNREIVLYDCMRFTTVMVDACIPSGAGTRAPRIDPGDKDSANDSSIIRSMIDDAFCGLDFDQCSGRAGSNDTYDLLRISSVIL